MDAAPIRVLIVDDHAMVRRGMRDFVELHPDLEVVGEAADGQAALDATARLALDVVVMDLLMPGLDGIAATAELRLRHPSVQVVAITAFPDERRITAALEAGGSGILLKDAGADDLARAIRSAHGGEVYLDPTVAALVSRRIRDHLGTGRRVTALPSRGSGGEVRVALTARELEVLAGLARGLSNRAIAAELGVTERTARTHVSNILGKLGLTSRTQAALHAVEHGMVKDR